MILLLLQLFSSNADGQRYLSRPAALEHSIIKTIVSTGFYYGLREVGVKKVVSKIIAVGGVFLVSKGIERLKGHTLGPIDTINDLAAHSLFVIKPGIMIGIIWISTCKYSSPKWC